MSRKRWLVVGFDSCDPFFEVLASSFDKGKNLSKKEPSEIGNLKYPYYFCHPIQKCTNKMDQI